MYLPLFLDYGLILSNSCHYFTSFNPVVDLVIPKGLSIKEAKALLEIHPVTVEDKIRKCSI